MSCKICQDGIDLKLVDGQSSAHSIWMRFVNCTWNEGEQNLQVYQYCGKIYYRTLKTIELHTELLVGYGDYNAIQHSFSISQGNCIKHGRGILLRT